VHRPFRHGEPLVQSEYDGVPTLDVERDLAFEDEKELVLIDVLVPWKISLKNSKTNDCIVDRREGLIEPGRVGCHFD